MKRILMFFLAITAGTAVLAQSGDEEMFHFRAMEDKLDDSAIDLAFIRGHFMGEDVAKKLYLLRERYTWVEEESSTNPTPKTYIDKPAIYNSVKKLERYYKKGIKKGYIKEEMAIAEFQQILDIAIFIRNQQTAEFEDLLDQLKEEEQIVGMYTKKVLLSY
ncbi:MAG: hypothetical protein RIC30_21615 [Marinoscillum sp.]|uniref:hypothetical protein n=1 Tax=Marinoscillum sp. TaxID=2024838 RepID=UPI003300DF33